MLSLGTAKVDITPQFPVPLAGFAFRSGVFEQVLTPLFARIFCLRPESGPPVIVVSADLIWWGSDRVPALTERIRENAANAVVLLHATHNHSGPQTAGNMSLSIGEPCSAWLEFMEHAVVAGVRDAMATCEPVSIARGSGECKIGVHRRRLIDGSIQMAPNPEGPVDPECTVIRFQTANGATKAILVHFTCHPTTAGINAVHSEYCGAAMAAIEIHMGNGAIAGFLQGCCGDIRPALIRDDQFYRGDTGDVRRLGNALSDVIFDVLARPMRPCEPLPCIARNSAIPLLFENIPERSVPLEMMNVRLAEGLGFLTFNAEMVVQFGFLVKKAFLLPLGYTNGMIGYVTTEQQLAEGGYESREAFRYFGMPGPFEHSTERRIKDAITQIS